MPDRNDLLANGPEHVRYAREERLREEMRGLYAEDLRELLKLPAGRRVLFHWLDAPGLFGEICASGEEMVRVVAVTNYVKQRLCEIRKADPDGYLKIMRAGMDMQTPTTQENEHA